MATPAADTTAPDTAPLTLTPPAPVPVVAPEKAAGLVPLAPETRGELDDKVQAFLTDLVAQDAHSPAFGQRVDQLTAMGRKEIAAAAGLSNRFLDRPAKAIDKDSGVAAHLLQLRRTVEGLDPGKAMRPRKLVDKLPFGNRMKRYFNGYVSAQGHIKGILDALARGRDELLMDNAAIDVERQKLWQAMAALEQMIHIARSLDEGLTDKAAELDHTDPAKARALRESALFYTRQRRQDLLTQMAVSVQGYLALDLVKKNNIELVKGVDRASTTTVAALRTAVTVAMAMTNQRLVLGQITALNDTTAKIIDSTGTLLKDQTAKIHEQAAASTIPLEVLQRAFQNIYETMDNIDSFKLKALDAMKQTVATLGAEVEKSRGYIARAQGSDKGGSQTAVAQDSPGLLSLEG